MLDPSSRGMNKQTMLDWMRINHPQTPIKSGITKNEVSKMVREAQPEYFPDPDSEAPAVDLTTSIYTPSLSGNSTRSINSIPSPAKENSPAPLPAPVEAPLPSESSTNINGKKKRTASDEINSERVFKRSDKDHLDILTNPSVAIKKPKWLSKPGKSQCTLPKGASLNRVIPAKSMSQFITLPVKTEALDNTQDFTPPLIDVSETNWMDSPNPVVGQDIPPIGLLPVLESGKSLKRKSGVEVFKEERQRVQQIRELEEAVEQLRVKLETNEKSDMSVLAEEMRRDEEVRLLTVRVEGLEHQVTDIGLLKATVTKLESRVGDLCGQLSTIVEDLKVQEQVITRLMTLEDGDEDGSIISSQF